MRYVFVIVSPVLLYLRRFLTCKLFMESVIGTQHVLDEVDVALGKVYHPADPGLEFRKHVCDFRGQSGKGDLLVANVDGHHFVVLLESDDSPVESLLLIFPERLPPLLLLF